MRNEQILKKAIEKYNVNELGEVYSKKTGKQLKALSKRSGHTYISFYIGNGVTKAVSIHRLVAYKYIPNPNNKPHINHKNSNPSDNRVENLEWCTAKENVIHGFLNGRQVWNKGTLSKSQIYRLCKRTPRKMFWILTANNFTIAKAFWGEKEIETSTYIIRFESDGKYTSDHYDRIYQKSWQYHLQRMVVSEDPIKYLEQFL